MNRVQSPGYAKNPSVVHVNVDEAFVVVWAVVVAGATVGAAVEAFVVTVCRLSVFLNILQSLRPFVLL